MMSVDIAIADVMVKARALAEAKEREAMLEDVRPIVKRDCVLALIRWENPLTGKLHSASSAAEVWHDTAAGAAHLLAQREATVATILAYGEYEAAKFRARLLTGTAEAA